MDYGFIDGMMICEDEDILHKGFARVLDFNLTARGKHDFSLKTVQFQKTLVNEEMEELMEAIFARDRTEVIDALCDLFVVGTYWHFLAKMNDYLEGVGEDELHNTREGSLRRSMYQMVEEDSVREVEDYLASGRFGGESPGYLVSRLKDSIDSDFSHTAVTLIAELLRSLNFDHETALNQVLSSNDSKLPKYAELKSELDNLLGDGLIDFNTAAEELVLSVQAELLNSEHAGRYEGITGSLLNGRAVFKDSNGKIMKPCTFFQPKLENL